MKALGLAVGFRFRPTDEELLVHYLYNKMTDQPLPAEGFVTECDIYGEENPWEIWDRYNMRVDIEEKDFYVFTKVKKVSAKGSRISRKIGLGSWEAENCKKIPHPKTKKTIGSVRRFRFKKSGTIHDNGWIMFEYNLDKLLLGNAIINNDYVLCRIRKNEAAEPQQRNESGAEQKRKRQLEEKQSRKMTKKQKLERKEISHNEGILQLEPQEENRLLCSASAPAISETAQLEAEPQEDFFLDFPDDDEDLNLSINIDELLEFFHSEDHSMPNSTNEGILLPEPQQNQLLCSIEALEFFHSEDHSMSNSPNEGILLFEPQQNQLLCSFEIPASPTTQINGTVETTQPQLQEDFSTLFDFTDDEDPNLSNQPFQFLNSEDYSTPNCTGEGEQFKDVWFSDVLPLSFVPPLR